MVELSWPQTRSKLLTRLSRLDPHLVARANEAESRYSHARDHFVVHSAYLDEQANLGPEIAPDASEDDLLPDSSHETVPDYLR